MLGAAAIRVLRLSLWGIDSVNALYPRDPGDERPTETGRL